MTDQPDTVQHEGEYWATQWRGKAIELWPGEADWSFDLPRSARFTVDHELWATLDELADPDQPVRVRLELRAVRVEEESDGE